MASPTRRIVIVGNLNMDFITMAERVPGEGEYLYCNEIKFVPGGNGLNQAVAASRLGGNVRLVGFVGEDGFGRELLDFMKKEKLDTSSIKTMKNVHSGTVIYMITGKVERHLVHPGSNMEVKIKDLDGVDIMPSDIVISQLTLPQEVIIEAFKRARTVGATTMLNLFPNYDVQKELLKLCDYVVLNEVELAFRTGSKEFVDSQHKTLNMDQATVMKLVKQFRTSENQIIITTLAERGSVEIQKDNATLVKGIKINFVDATGAGDCFLGSLAAAMAEGMDHKASLEFANCAAALSVQKIGATTSFPSRKEVDAFLKKQK